MAHGGCVRIDAVGMNGHDAIEEYMSGVMPRRTEVLTHR